MNIISGKIKSPQKIVIYGPEGIGKSTFASKFPDPLFIDTEGGTKQIDVKRTESPGSFEMLLMQCRYVVDHPDICKTLVIDTADWAEKLCITEVCVRNKKDGIEDFGYGKGYVYLLESFANLLTVLDEVIRVGIHVVILAHAFIRKFEQPDEMGAYDRWELKLTKKVAPVVKEWADMLLFVNYKTYVVNVDGHGSDKGKNKATGGKRVIYTTHTPSWDAKNRHGLPDEIPLDYAAIAGVIDANTPERDEIIDEPVKAAEAPIADDPDDEENPFKDVGIDDPDFTEIDDNAQPIPMDLGELMKHCNVREDEVRQVVSQKGYYPIETPISNYEPAFITGVLVGAWEQVFGMIKENRKEKSEGEQLAI